MRKILFAAASFAALAGAATIAIAQDNDGDANHRRGHLGLFHADANNDGVLTRAEFDAGRAALFARMDANNDGQLTADERRMRRHARGHGMRHLGSADDNNDGSITRDEFLARPLQHFQRLDANNDGVISADERPQRRERREGGERRHGRMDANGDGQITQAEFAAAGAAMFERLDANNDGRVTQEEAQAARGRHGRGR